MQPRAFSYLRFSRPEQMKGDSLRRQTEGSLRWCERNNIPLDDSLSLADRGVSAFKGKNANEGALADFMAAIETGRVRPGDYLIVESLDRITRQKLGAAQGLVQRILSNGVNIVTLSPERVFTPSAANDIGQAIEILIVLARAHDESRIKSERVGKAWKNKRDNASSKKLTKRACSWLQLSDDRKSFRLVREKVTIIRRIFDMAETLGLTAIANTLNEEKVPPLSHGRRWRTSSIRRVLTGQEVLGFYQPHVLTDEGRKPVGNPVRDYYPRIIEDDQYYRVQSAIRSRHMGGGPTRKRIANLFTGLLFDEQGETFHWNESNPNETYLRSPNASMPYKLFERSLLVWAADLDLSDVLPRNKQERVNRLPDLTAKHEGLVRQLDELKQRVRQGGEGGVLFDLMQELDADRLSVAIEIERAKAEASSTASDALGTVSEILLRIDSSEGDELYQLRARLRRALKRLVNRIRVNCRRDEIYRIDLLIELSNGNQRSLTIRGSQIIWTTDNIPVSVDGEAEIWRKSHAAVNPKARALDLSEKHPELLPYKSKAGIEEAVILHDRKNRPLKEIAEKVGISITQVSRILVRNGRRRIAPKRTGGPNLMNWHEAARGWVKTRAGKRFYVGCGTLRELFPNLIDGAGKDSESTWKAANAWWDMFGPK